MITFSDAAKEKVLSFIKGNPDKKGHMLRIVISGQSATSFNYQFFLDDEKNTKPEDTTVELDGFNVLIDSQTSKNINGATVEWKETSGGSGFHVENPNQPKNNLGDPIAQKIAKLLESEINPNLASHGGGVELIDVQGKKAFVRLGGGCQGCGMARVTLKQGIETRIKEEIPEIEEVVDVTDHAGGSNPYYQS